MKIIFLSFILTLSVQAQVNSYINAFVFGAFDGTKEGMKLEDKYRENRGDPSAERYNRAWHKYQFLANVSGVALGFNIALDSYEDGWWEVLKSAFTSGVIFYNVREVFMNVTRGRDVFARPTHNYSGLEQFNFLKIPLIIIAIGVQFL